MLRPDAVCTAQMQLEMYLRAHPELRMQVSIKEAVPVEAFELDEAEVDAVKWVAVDTLEGMYRAKDPSLVPADLNGPVRSLLGNVYSLYMLCCFRYLQAVICA